MILGITFKENCPDIRNTKVLDIINHLREYGIEPQVVDPWADKELVKQEYGGELKEWSEIQNADCVIHAVAHGEFRDRGLEGVGSLMGTERSKKILLDIKGEWSVDALNKSGVIWWRM